MADREHDLKCWPEPYEAICRGDKTHEFRQDDGRDYRVGDVLKLREWTCANVGVYTGRWIRVRVTYLSRGPEWGIPDGFVAMSIKRMTF